MKANSFHIFFFWFYIFVATVFIIIGLIQDKIDLMILGAVVACIASIIDLYGRIKLIEEKNLD